MSFWNSQRLGTAIPAQDIVSPFRSGRVKNCAYELSVDGRHYSTDMKEGVETTPTDQMIVIPPGQLAILVTQETVKIPLTAVGFISMKFSAKIRGLINVSGFHVDPGFQGHLKFAVYNAGSNPSRFSPGQALFQLWLADLCSTAEPYNGVHDGGNQISAKDVSDLYGNVASPAQLKSEIDDLAETTRKAIAEIGNSTKSQSDAIRFEMRVLEVVFVALFTTLLAVLIAVLAQGNPTPVNVYTAQPLANEESILEKDPRPESAKDSTVAEPPNEDAPFGVDPSTRPEINKGTNPDLRPATSPNEDKSTDSTQKPDSSSGTGTIKSEPKTTVSPKGSTNDGKSGKPAPSPPKSQQP